MVSGGDKHFLYGNDVSGVDKKGLGYSALQDRILEVKKTGKSVVFCQTPLGPPPRFGIFMKNIKFQCVFWPFLTLFKTPK